MKLVLKNLTRKGIKTIFQGREVWFGPKQSQIFDMDKEDDHKRYFFWKDTYGFIIDITKNLKEVK